MYVHMYVQVHTPYMRTETKKEVLLYPAHFGSILCTACRLMRKLYDYILQAAHWSLGFLDYLCIVHYIPVLCFVRVLVTDPPTYVPTYLPYEERLQMAAGRDAMR